MVVKTIGILGGMSWESTQTYYRVINETVREVLGGLHSAKILLYSVDFDEIERYQAEGDWHQAGVVLAQAASRLERAGADLLVVVTNTMHKVASQIEDALSIPLLHIADATAHELTQAGVRTVGLLGTKYTMTQEFYVSRLREAELQVVLPSAEDIELVNRVIYEELCLGNVDDASRTQFLRVIETMKEQGAQAVILGCTEIGLLIQQEIPRCRSMIQALSMRARLHRKPSRGYAISPYV